MDVRTERTESLPSRSPGDSFKRGHTTSPPITSTEDKDSIYTFSDNCKSDNDESRLSDIEKFAPKNSRLFDTEITSDNNSNNTRSLLTCDVPITPKAAGRRISEEKVHTAKSPESTNVHRTLTTTSLMQPPTTVPLPPSSNQMSQQQQRANGTIDSSIAKPKKVLSGKPLSFALAESNKTNSSKSKGARGRPKRKALVAMYQSQLADKGIRLKLQKSQEPPLASTHTKKKSSPSNVTPTGSATTGATTKSSRKRPRKSKHKDTSDSDDSEYEKRRRNNNGTSDKFRNRKTTSNDYTEPEEQSGWGSTMPEEILLKIFEDAVNEHGCLPTVVNISKVCSLWRRVAQHPKLWHTLDLATWTKDRSELNLKLIIQNHLHSCKDVNLGEYRNGRRNANLSKLLI